VTLSVSSNVCGFCPPTIFQRVFHLATSSRNACCNCSRSVRGVATVRHFRHVPTHNLFPNFFLLMKNDKQRITYFNYVCFIFITVTESCRNKMKYHTAETVPKSCRNKNERPHYGNSYKIL
jgi:hypothetical protein